MSSRVARTPPEGQIYIKRMEPKTAFATGRGSLKSHGPTTTEDDHMPNPIWTPSKTRIDACVVTDFRAWLEETRDVALNDSIALHAWSVTERAAFWDAIWDYFGVIGGKRNDIVHQGANMLDDRFFPGARLNFAENLLSLAGEPGLAPRRELTEPVGAVQAAWRAVFD